ncbi:MAG TPA: hypothetical protein VNY35_12455 [Solirubrobacteraceae bacterium]|nr:hypothetical protein [Solirubrobacteraceae bacterium]
MSRGDFADGIRGISPRRRVDLVARGWLVIVVLVAIVTAYPSSAHADADPASDVLLIQSAFYPYQPPVSPLLSAALDKVLRAAGRTGLKLKVAIIGSPEDLGGVFELFGHPQQYAEFLDREISFNTRQSLLVVMPAGFGTVATGPSRALAGLKVDTKHSSFGLTRSAILAVVALVRAAGHAIAPPVIPSESSGRGGAGPPALLLFGLPVVLVVLAALAVRRGGRSSAKDAGVSE